MPKLYTAYIRAKVRKVIAEKEIPLERAITFLKQNKLGVITDSDNNELTLEELKNVKSFRSESGSREDNLSASRGEVSQDTDRELFSFTRDNTE